MISKSSFLLLAIFVANVACQDQPQPPAVNATQKSGGRMFSFLQVLKFPNDVCPGTSRNGTCYSSDECLAKGGTSSGSCADGFGVCCVFELSCGQKSSENNTYLVMSSTTSPKQSVCTYTLCESNPSVCRIRLDFTSFTIAGPTAGSIVAAAADSTTKGGATGDCTSDTFTLTSPGNRASPVICGVNTNQHMYIDTSSSSCAEAVFNFGSGSTARQYDIKVTQYNCGDEKAGPPDCLQYFTGNTGTVKSFNFATTNGKVTSQVTHLSSQFYSMCFRRNAGKCAICFTPSVPTSISAADQSSFGLSLSGNDPAESVINTGCSTDYLVVPYGVNNAMGMTTVLNNAGTNNGVNRICGRFFNAMDAQTASATVCTGQRPFKISFNTDANEVFGIAFTAAANMATAKTNEDVGFPSGFMGFSLDFFQLAC